MYNMFKDKLQKLFPYPISINVYTMTQVKKKVNINRSENNSSEKF
jgi:hypothetical protein